MPRVRAPRSATKAGSLPICRRTKPHSPRSWKRSTKPGYRAGQDIYLGLDVASNELYKNGVYELASEGRKFNASEFADYLAGLVAKYPIVTVEDGMSEDDWDGWAILTQKLGRKVQLVGDDLFVTNTKIFAEGIAKKIANAILIKPNQIGTLTETLAAIDMAAERQICRDRLASFRRDRGCHDCRYCRGDHGHPDQDRLDVALRSRRQVQPAAANRGRAGTRKAKFAGMKALAVPVS